MIFPKLFPPPQVQKQKQKQPFKNLEIRGGRGAPKYSLERKFQGDGGGAVEKTFHGGVWTFSATTQCCS